MLATIESIIEKLDELVARKDVALVGPLVWYPADERNSIDAEPDDRVWTVHLSVPGNQENGGFYNISLYLGLCAYEPDPADFAGYDGVLVLRRSDERTREQAQAIRSQLIEGLRSQFEKVQVASTELEAVQMIAREWPGERSERILRDVTAEQQS